MDYKDRRTSKRIKTPLENCILASLNKADQKIVLPRLEIVELTGGSTFLNAGEKFSEIIFPTTSLISLQFASEDGKIVEVDAIGNEGFVGASYVKGRDISTLQINVIYTGFAYSIKANDFHTLLEKLPQLKSKILLYTQALLSKTWVNVACHRLHSIEQQYAKMLLSTADSLATNTLLFSQLSISDRLGVRRESVTVSSKKFKEA